MMTRKMVQSALSFIHTYFQYVYTKSSETATSKINASAQYNSSFRSDKEVLLADIWFIIDVELANSTHDIRPNDTVTYAYITKLFTTPSAYLEYKRSPQRLLPSLRW